MSSSDDDKKVSRDSSTQAVVPVTPMPLARVQRSLDVVKTILTEARLSSLQPQPAKLIPFRKGNKFGIIDWSGSWPVEAMYDDVLVLAHDIVAVEQNDKWDFISDPGKLPVELRFDEIWYPSEGFVPVQQSNRWGFTELSGEQVIPCQFDRVGAFSNSLAWAELDGSYKFIDHTGHPVFEIGGVLAELDDIFPNNFSDDLLSVNCKYPSSDATWHDSYFVNKSGRCVSFHGLLQTYIGLEFPSSSICLERKYEWLSSFSEGLCAVRHDGKYGFIDKTGTEVIPCKYSAVNDFHEGQAAVQLNGKYGYVDTLGADVIPWQYDFADDFRQGVASVKVGNLYGLIDKVGNLILPPTYDAIWSFFDGLASARKHGLFGFIDTSGNEIIPCRYTESAVELYPRFRNGLAYVVRDQVTFYIDASGHEYYEP